jgi:hypothetical protein
MQTLHFSIRFIAVCLVLFGLVILFTPCGSAIVIGSVIALSGSTANAAQDFIQSVLPVAHLLAGFVFCGGLVALGNVIVAPRGIGVESIIVISLVGGALALMVPFIGSALLA